MILGPDGKPYYTKEEIEAQNTKVEPKGKITPTFLKTLPIPDPIRKRNLFRKKKVAGTPTRVSTKLHCNTCGKKRLMRIASMVLNPEGTPTPLYFNLKKLLKATKTDIVLPENFLGYCLVCLEVTPFKLNQNRKLVAQHSSVLNIGTEILNNERTDSLDREVPTT